MNTKYILFILFVLLAQVLSACGSAATPAVPAKDMSDPVTIVQTFYEAFNEKDLDKAMGLIAEDYVMTDPSGTYDRAAALVQWQAVIEAGISFNPTNFVHTGNGRVTSCYEVFENGSMIDKGCGSVTRVRDGKIIFDGLEAAEGTWVAQEFYEALNDGDIEAAMALVAEDVICRSGCYMTGKQSFRSYIQGTIKSGIQTELSDFKVEGDKVTYNWVAYNQNGTAVMDGIETVQVKDGLIILLDGGEQATSEPADPAAIMQSFYKALDDGDLEAAMALLADDVKFRGVPYITGKDAVRRYLQTTIDDEGWRQEFGDLKVEGDKVTYNVTVYNPNGAVAVRAVETLQIKDGLIILIESVAQ